MKNGKKIIGLWLITGICGSGIGAFLLKINYGSKSDGDHWFVRPAPAHIAFMWAIFTIASLIYSIPGVFLYVGARTYIQKKISGFSLKLLLSVVAAFILSISLFVFSFTEFFHELCTGYILSPRSEKLFTFYPYEEYHQSDLFYLLISYLAPLIIWVFNFEH